MFIDANNSTSFACPNCNAFFPFHLTVVNGLNRSTAKGTPVCWLLIIKTLIVICLLCRLADTAQDTNDLRKNGGRPGPVAR